MAVLYYEDQNQVSSGITSEIVQLAVPYIKKLFIFKHIRGATVPATHCDSWRPGILCEVIGFVLCAHRASMCNRHSFCAVAMSKRNDLER